MGRFTAGPLPEVRMPCGPVAGIDGKRHLQRPSSEDHNRLGAPGLRSGDLPSVAQVTTEVRVSGGSTAIHPPHPNPPPPSSPAPWGPCFSSFSTAFPACPESRDQSSPRPLPGMWAGVPGGSSTIRVGTRASG